MKLFITDTGEDKKCGGCNWRTSTFYGIGDTVDNARNDFKDNGNNEDYGLGLCANCMCELIVDERFELSNLKVGA